MKVALITGITGQDGSFLADFLLEKKYKIYGIIRRSSSINTKRIDHIYDHPLLQLVYGDLTDSCSMNNVILRILREVGGKENLDRFEVYNLAAQSHVKVSFELPEYTSDVDAMGTLRLLEALVNCGLSDKVRFYQASTSELYGKVQETPQTETTPFYPRSPYGVAKLYAYWIVVNYRESYGMFTCNGILFNHESERRGETFITRKITIGIGKMLRGEQDCITLGNMYSKRDWGYAKDYVEAMWLMLQQEKPDDFVIATGKQYSVKEFIEFAFEEVGIQIRWEGKGINEVGYNGKNAIVKVDKRYFRPAEVESLIGDYSKANQSLHWTPKTDFKELIKIMVENDK